MIAEGILSPIADSNAINSAHVLSQHQSALTLLQDRLSNPATTSFSWLDLACGRGQLIVFLNDNLSAESRAKVRFYGYDVDKNYTLQTQQTAEQLGFASTETSVGDIVNFNAILDQQLSFDFITLTNTVHEIEPFRLAKVIGNAVSRLTDTGTLFIYDMEKITPPELGAVPWTRDDIKAIIGRLLDGLGVSAYHAEVGLWNHKTTTAWNVLVKRENFSVTRADLDKRIEAAIDHAQSEICALLKRRLVDCRKSLDSLTKYIAQTSAEIETRDRLLFEFWATSHALQEFGL